MPAGNGADHDGQPEWPAYAVAITIVGLVLAIANIPFAIVLVAIAIYQQSVASIVFWLALVGLPTILLDRWLIGWLKDNMQVFHWTNQRLHQTKKGDRSS